MKKYECRFYEGALILCLGFRERGAETSIAIDETIKIVGLFVDDIDDLRDYLEEYIQ